MLDVGSNDNHLGTEELAPEAGSSSQPESLGTAEGRGPTGWVYLGVLCVALMAAGGETVARAGLWPWGLVVVVAFPFGLMPRFMDTNPNLHELFGWVVWLTYAALFAMGVTTRRKWFFRIFCILLIVNVIGYRARMVP
jgi:hypothetical protein